MFYVIEQSPSEVLSLESIPMDIELLEFPTKNWEWLCIDIYRLLPQNKNKYFIDPLWKALGQLTC